MGLIATVYMDDTLHNALLSCLYYCYAEWHFAEWHNAKRHYAEWHYAQWHYAEWHYAEQHYAEWHYDEWHYDEQYYAEWHYDEWHYTDWLYALVLRSVAKMIVITSGTMLNVVTQLAIMPSVFTLRVIMKSV